MSATALVGNILWLFLGAGVGCFIFWILAGCVLFLSIVGIPFGYAAFRIAAFAAFPFGQRLIDVEEYGQARIPGTMLGNILWIVLAGLWLALFHAIAGVFYCVTIIGIPFGLAHLKLASVSFAPLGKRVVPVDAAPQRAL